MNRSIEAGLALATQQDSGSPETLEPLNGLRAKETGFKILLVGISESCAARTTNLTKAIKLLEDEIFDVEVLPHLPMTEKIERYKLANDALTANASFIKANMDSIDWDSLEINLINIMNNPTDTVIGDADSGAHSLKDIASKLLAELGSRVDSDAE